MYNVYVLMVSAEFWKNGIVAKVARYNHVLGTVKTGLIFASNLVKIRSLL